MIVVVDYGLNNLSSVKKALLKMHGRVKVTPNGAEIQRAKKIVLPGVGAFKEAVGELKKRKIFGTLREMILAGTPFLGICLGHQLLFEKSQEAEGVSGLGIFKGEVVRFKESWKVKVPHMGWNSIKVKNRKGIFTGVSYGAFVYFCHSYHVVPEDKTIIASTTPYGMDFVSSVSRGNIFGTQFHLEKSQQVGLKILDNFVKC